MVSGVLFNMPHIYNLHGARMVEKNKIKVSITLIQDVVEWGKKVLKEGRYAGVRSFSGLVEFLLRREMKKYEDK